MLAVSGLPDRLLDEGLDALDFGITAHEDQRGLLLTRVWILYRRHHRSALYAIPWAPRPTDQSHCGKAVYSEALASMRNSALIVSQRGPIRIAGAGMVTIVEPDWIEAMDGPFGYSIAKFHNDVTEGDTFDPTMCDHEIDAASQSLVADKVEYSGNFMINDIAADRAVPFVLVNGLAENTRSSQMLFTTKYHGEWMHGFRFRFRKQPTCARLWWHHERAMDVQSDQRPT